MFTEEITKKISRKVSQDTIEPGELLAHLIPTLNGIEARIDELDRLLKDGYIVPRKRKEIQKVLERHQETRIMLQKTLLQIGGIKFLSPYWQY